MRICAFCPQGYDGYIIDVECDIQRGLPCFIVVGLPDSAIREARERVRSAIIAIGAEFPAKRILISLSPGGIKKLGSGYDLAIAVAILLKSEQLVFTKETDYSCLFLGELGLNGNIKGAALDYAALLSPQTSDFDHIIISCELMKLAQQLPLPNTAITGHENLASLRNFQPTISHIEVKGDLNVIATTPNDMNLPLIADPKMIRSLEVSAAGFHNILLYGTPGSGKTTAARGLASIMPPADKEILSEQMRIHFRSMISFQQNLRGCSFREPHHSSSAEGILGGGKSLKPGEISLAHGGVLLLDESPEFHRHVLQNLREPMESGQIQLIRADNTSSYPCTAIFLFIMNLCPCGNRGKSDAICMCSEGQLNRYWSQLGGAMYDRIEIKQFCPAQGFSHFVEPKSDEYNNIKNRIVKARWYQWNRYGNTSYNAYASWQKLISVAECYPDTLKLIDDMQRRFFLSGRQCLNLLRLALTMSDLDPDPDPDLRSTNNIIRETNKTTTSVQSPENTKHITKHHVDEALSLIRPEEFGEYF